MPGCRPFHRSLLTTFACLTLTAVAPAAAQTETAPAASQPAAAVVDEKAAAIVDRSIDVTFGKAAKTRSAKTFRMKAEMAMPAQGMQADVLIVMGPDRQSRNTIELAGLGKMLSGVNKEFGWSFSELQGPAIMSAKEHAQALEQADMYAEVDYRDHNTKVTYAGEETIENLAGEKRETDVVVFVSRATGIESKVYFDKEHGYRIRADSTQFAPGAGEIPTTTLFGEYTRHGDMLVPHKSVIKVAGMTQEITVKELEINPKLPDDAFAIPEEIKAMRKG